MSDHVDTIQAQWLEVLPELNTEGMAVLGRIFRIATAVNPKIGKNFAEHGLKAGEFDVLATLRRSGAPYELTPTDLYSALMISSGGLTHRLKTLEAKKLIKRRQSSDDGRSFSLRLTSKARLLVDRTVVNHMRVENGLIESLDARDRKQLAKLLRKLCVSLETTDL